MPHDGHKTNCVKRHQSAAASEQNKCTPHSAFLPCSLLICALAIFFTFSCSSLFFVLLERFVRWAGLRATQPVLNWRWWTMCWSMRTAGLGSTSVLTQRVFATGGNKKRSFGRWTGIAVRFVGLKKKSFPERKKGSWTTHWSEGCVVLHEMLQTRGRRLPSNSSSAASKRRGFRTAFTTQKWHAVGRQWPRSGKGLQWGRQPRRRVGLTNWLTSRGGGTSRL